MTTHVAQGTCSEIPPTSPFEWVIKRVIVNIICWSDEQIPVGFAHGIWQLRFSIWHRNTLWPNRPISPNINSIHRTYKSFFMPLYHLLLTRIRSSLITHLRYDFVFSRRFCQHTGFINIVRQGLLNIHMLAHLHGGHSCHTVYVVWC